MTAASDASAVVAEEQARDGAAIDAAVIANDAVAAADEQAAATDAAIQKAAQS